MEAYFDNSATTFVCEKAKEKMLSAISTLWGNPSSLHQKGIDAQLMLDEARSCTAKKLGCSEKEIIFTCGGTQGNNIAVFGAARTMKRRGNKVITTAVEHPSVSKAFDRLEEDGFEVVRLPVDRFGKVSIDELQNTIDEKTILVSMMAVNNELGTIEPIGEVKRIITSANSPALFHVDAVQAFGKIDINVKRLGADLMTVSSHKIHGPKGAGALFVKNGVRLVSPVVGGEQERDIRPGTEPMPAIAGFMGAVESLEISKSLEKITVLRDYLTAELRCIDGVIINSDEDALPYIVNISLPGLPSETVLNLLSDMEIYVSTGSACAKGHKSPVLTAAGLDNALINSSVRISMSRFTEKQEIDYLLEGIKTALKVIRKKI
ncbi:MAG: cysteine desulfurase [Faecalibacterium sp.]|nr:cysteine desulfurase [Ruminococcus sp.]MCM1392564.1 cysteine desulfurase [Ruminococcus sp.]MCM1485639.1 cysteine desulfurase [Faecalibacterium sp.]